MLFICPVATGEEQRQPRLLQSVGGRQEMRAARRCYNLDTHLFGQQTLPRSLA